MAGRDLVGMEFLSREGFRLELDADGWRLQKPRTLGEGERRRAEALLAAAEASLPPPAADGTPPTLTELGAHAAQALGLRITHQRWRRR